jgi:hypothetical protein
MARRIYLQMRGKTHPTTNGDEPFGGVVLIPPDGVPKIRGELVVEVVITLAQCNHCSDDMITGSVLVVKRCITEPVRQRVNAECGVMEEEKSGSSGIEISAPPIAPKYSRNSGWNTKAHKEDEPDIPTVLPPDNLVFAEIRDIRDTRFAPRLDDHPANVRPQQTAMGIIRVEVRIRVPVVRAMSTRPPLDRPLHRTCTSNSKKVL